MRLEVPAATLTRLRALCMALPQVTEETAWAGTRWCVRRRNFAQVLMIDGGWPPAYARAAGNTGPLCVLTFRSPLPAQNAQAFAWAPFFKPGWFPDLVGLRLQGRTDWREVDGLLRESWRLLAPKKLAALLG